MDGLLCEEKQLILSRFNLMPWKIYYLLFQKAAPFRQDWSKEPALSCLRHRGNSIRILHHKSGFIIIMLPLGAAGSSRRSRPCGKLKRMPRKSLEMRYRQSCPKKAPRCPGCFYTGPDHADHRPCLQQPKWFWVRSKPVEPPAVSGRN